MIGKTDKIQTVKSVKTDHDRANISRDIQSIRTLSLAERRRACSYAEARMPRTASTTE